MKICNSNNAYVIEHGTIVNGNNCTIYGNNCIVNGSNCEVRGDNCIINGHNCVGYGSGYIVNGQNFDNRSTQQPSQQTFTTFDCDFQTISDILKCNTMLGLNQYV